MTIKGRVMIRNVSADSKSDGNKAYLINANNLYQLCRTGVYEINDDFFYQFNMKNVIVEGEIRNKWLVVKKIEIDKE